MIKVPNKEDFESDAWSGDTASLDINDYAHPEYWDFVRWLEDYNNVDPCSYQHEIVHEGIPLSIIHSGFIGIIIEQKHLDEFLSVSKNLLSTRILDI